MLIQRILRRQDRRVHLRVPVYRFRSQSAPFYPHQHPFSKPVPPDTSEPVGGRLSSTIVPRVVLDLRGVHSPRPRKDSQEPRQEHLPVYPYHRHNILLGHHHHEACANEPMYHPIWHFEHVQRGMVHSDLLTCVQ